MYVCMYVSYPPHPMGGGGVGTRDTGPYIYIYIYQHHGSVMGMRYVTNYFGGAQSFKAEPLKTIVAT